MSILETPRILFRGNIAWDPIVTNNTNDFYDEDSAQSELPDGTVVRPPAAVAHKRVLQFRQAAIQSSVWNPQGTHRSTFFDLTGPDPSCPDSLIFASQVSGVDLGAGPESNDTFVGTPARFTGMLVDLEPYGGTSSQLFFDSFSLGIGGGCRILARRRARVTARQLNFNRNPVGVVAGIASVVWQTSFLKEDLTVDAYDSKGLNALAAAMGEAGVIGLTIRFNTYRTIYFDTPMTDKTQWTPEQTALNKKLQLKDPYGNAVWQPNPARSKMVGVVGLWRDGEPMREPGDRALATQGTIGTAFAHVDGSKVTLDLGNCVPETGLDLTKQDLGALDLCAVTSAGAQVLATLQPPDYDRAAYETGSGLVAKTIDPARLAADAVLELRQGSQVLLAETPVRVVPVEPNVYADEDAATTLKWQIYSRGQPGGAGIPSLTVATLDINFNPLGQTTAPADASGLVKVQVPAAKPGVTVWVALAPGQDRAKTPFDPMVYPYANLRRLPIDANVGALPPTWDNVYSEVLANWNAMAPCMDNWLDLYDPNQVRAFAPVLKRLTDPANFEAFRYMPVTRDMTRGQRSLLYAFLDAPAEKPKAAVAEEAAEPVLAAEAPVAERRPAAAEPLNETAKLNRAMRET